MNVFKEHEKFWAFLALVVAIVGLAYLGTSLGATPTRSDAINEANEATLLARLRILDGAVVGLIGIAGMAAQSLFDRRAPAEHDQSKLAEQLADKLPPPTGEAAGALGTTFTPPGSTLLGTEPIPMDSHAEDALPDGVDMEAPSWEKSS